MADLEPEPEPERRRLPFEELARLVRGPAGILESPWRQLDLQRLGRVLWHAFLVGVAAGFFAAAFYSALEWSQWLLFDELANLQLPRSAGEAALLPSAREAGPTRWWLVLLLPAAGGLLAGLLVTFVCPRAGGPGGDSYIASFHYQGGRISWKVPIVKTLATLLTIASGGSVGREGPTMQIAAGMASGLARRLKLTLRERRVLVVAGAAAATGAIFQIPLGGAIFATEILYRDDFETEALVPAILSSVTAYSIFTTIHGQGHLLATAEEYPFEPEALPLYAIMAVGLALFGVLWVKVRHGSRDRVFARLNVPGWARPAVGGLIVGLMALAVPQVLGAGYGLAQGAILNAEWIPEGNWGWVMLLGLAVAKIIATSASLGSGGAGGEFGPTLVIGGLVGGAFGLIFDLAVPSWAPDPGSFALVGMGAMLGGVAHVPISSLILVCELAGSYDLLVPLMLAEGITFVLLRRVHLYRRQVGTRLQSPAHRHEGQDILESIRVAEVYTRGARLDRVQRCAPLPEVLYRMSESSAPTLIVVDESDEPVGLISLDALQGALGIEGLDGLAMAADVMLRPVKLTPQDDLHAALHAFLQSGSHALPVCEDGEVVGVVTHDDVTRAYEREVAQRLGPDAAE
jgi:CIC family chloride channel protein